jgi:ribosome biogenesis GTPase
VVSVDRGRYGCVIDESDDASDFGHRRLLTAMKARELGKGSVVVGDRVALAGDTSGTAGSLARIVRVREPTPSPRPGSSTAAWSPPTTPASSPCWC